jgi:hypothetical protein
VLELFSHAGVSTELFKSAPHTRLKRINRLIEIKQIGAALF